MKSENVQFINVRRPGVRIFNLAKTQSRLDRESLRVGY